jgi:NAD-dependent deacetylase
MVANSELVESQAMELADILGYTLRGVFFGGAGVSTESGIPDFRSEASQKLTIELFGLPPEQILSIEIARENPVTFHNYFREHLVDRDARPNSAHLALAELESYGRLSAIVTQNIDGLHQMAGSQQVIELHGSVHRHYCEKCGAKFSLDWTFDPDNCRPPERVVPACPNCGGWVRPDIVLYGEPLPAQALEAAKEVIQQADVLIIGGTSLVVYPAAGYLGYFQGHTRIIINLEETPFDDIADLVIHAPIAQVLGTTISHTTRRKE